MAVVFEPMRILEVLADHGVEHILVGGIGAALHGSPLLTDDVDIVPSLNRGNLDALADALNALDARIQSADDPAGIAVDFTGPRLGKWIVEFRFLNLLTIHGRLDVMHRPAGTAGYQDLADSAEELRIESLSVRVAALEDIIRSKETVGRERDLQQLPTLRMLSEKKRGK